MDISTTSTFHPSNSDQQPPEFQTFIFCCSDDSTQLYPLTSETSPKFLLPICNIPLLQFQLIAIKKSNLKFVTLVILPQHVNVVKRFLQDLNLNVQKGFGGDLEIKIKEIDERRCSRNSVVEILRFLVEEGEVRSDFFMMDSNLVTNFNFNDLADLHRVNDCMLTIALKEMPKGKNVEEDKKIRKNYLSGTGDKVKFCAVVPPDDKCRGIQRSYNKIVYMKDVSKTEPFSVSKALLQKEERINIRTDLLDNNLYMLSKDVLKAVITDQGNRNLKSFYSEVLPMLFFKQYEDENSKDDIQEESTLSEKFQSHVDLHMADKLSSETEVKKNCFCYIIPAEHSYCRSVTNVQTYLQVNREVFSLPVSAQTPWNGALTSMVLSHAKNAKNSLVLEDSVVSDSCVIKDSIMGKNVTIKENVKIQNSVIMDGAFIDNDTEIINSVCGKECRISEGCLLQDCQVGDNVKIERTHAKNQSFTRTI